MNKLNLDITTYSYNELLDIFKINNVENSKQISTHINTYKNNIITDNSLSLSEKDNMTNFLNKVIKKILDSLDKSDNSSDYSSIGIRSVGVSDGGVSNNCSSLQNNLIENISDNHPVIVNQNTVSGLNTISSEGQNVGSNEFPPGYINPINIKTVKKAVNIDTRFRSSYYSTQSSDFHISLPESFKKVVSMQISSIEIPLTIYSVSEYLKNNSFFVDSSLVQISDGNYSSHADIYSPVIDLCNNISILIQNLLNTTGLSDISYTVNAVSGKSKFTTGATSHTLYFNKDICNNDDLDNPLPLKLGWLLGFRSGAYELASNSSIESEGILSIVGPKYIYLCINDYTNAGNNNFVAAFSSSILSPHIIARINYRGLVQNNGIYNVGSGGDFSDSINRTREYFGPVDIQKLHLQILDEYGRVVNFNNMDWSCAITFKTLYD